MNQYRCCDIHKDREQQRKEVLKEETRVKKYVVCADAYIEIKARSEKDAIHIAEKRKSGTFELSNFVAELDE